TWIRLHRLRPFDATASKIEVPWFLAFVLSVYASFEAITDWLMLPATDPAVLALVVPRYVALTAYFVRLGTDMRQRRRRLLWLLAIVGEAVRPAIQLYASWDGVIDRFGIAWGLFAMTSATIAFALERPSTASGP